MKVFKNNIATAKTKRAILEQAETMSRYIHCYERHGDDFVFRLNDEDRIVVRQNLHDSLFSRIFRLECSMMIHGVECDDDFEAKLQLSGFKEVKGAFKCTKGDPNYIDELNRSMFSEMLNNTLPDVQIESMKLKYSKSDKKMHVQIIPYAGSVIWLLIPPVSYHAKIWEKELKSIAELMQKLYNHIKAYEIDGACA